MARPPPAREARHVPLSRIVCTQGLRSVKEGEVSKLANSMALVGLITPITVSLSYRSDNPDAIVAPGQSRYYIIAGRHRFAAAQKLGWETIECFVDFDSDDSQNELVEIDENLCRVDLTPAEAAMHTARRKEIYETLHPEAKAQVRQANSRWHADDKLSSAFSDATAEATGRDKRTIQRDAARGEPSVTTFRL